MEATREEGGLLEQLRPPRIEDAGLEDCALPPESIKEAFLKAATAVRSRAVSILTTTDDETYTSENDCVKDPRPVTKELSDSLVGISLGSDPPPRPCAAEKCCGLPEVLGDKVAAGVTHAEEITGKLVVGTDLREDGEACVDGLQGLKIGKKVKDDVEEREVELPILAEGFV